MTGLKKTMLVLLASVLCIVQTRVIREPLSRIPGGIFTPEIPIRRIPDLPWLTIRPPRPTIKPPSFTIKPPIPIDPHLSERSELDLAFIMDSTGSMSPYINNVRQHIRDLVNVITTSSNTDLRVALIEYRDHKPEDTTFVTRTHHFTSSVSTMKLWLDAARANGGGDGPEAVADALYQATQLRWRPNAAKISVLISDAPPHGLVPSEDNSFPQGSPNGHDPIELARKLASKGITLYTVGCEPSILPYKDFFMALAFLTGGQYIPLSVPHFLTDAIIGGAKEELSLKKFTADVQKEIQKVVSAGGTVNEQQIASSVFTKLKSEGAKSQQLVKNNKPLEGASAQAKLIASAKSMADIRNRKLFTKASSGSRSSGGIKSIGRKIPTFESGLVPMRDRISRVLESSKTGSSGPSVVSRGAGESFAAVEKAVSLDQISRLVKQESAKLAL